MLDRPEFNHPALEQFAVVAERYCALVDHSDPIHSSQFLAKLHLALAQLYTGGLLLPSTDVLFSGDDSPADSDDDEPSTSLRADPDILGPDGTTSLRRRFEGISSP